MNQTFTIKSGDTSPSLVYTLSPPVNLVGASAVFNAVQVHSGVKINRAPAEIIDASGVLGFVFTAEQTASPGIYRAEFEVTLSDGSVETYPNANYLLLNIVPDLG
jgi:hypothetical protein